MVSDFHGNKGLADNGSDSSSEEIVLYIHISRIKSSKAFTFVDENCLKRSRSKRCRLQEVDPSKTHAIGKDPPEKEMETL
jgi:hypothetical protein